MSDSVTHFKNVTKVEILRQIQVHDMLSVGLWDTLKNVTKCLRYLDRYKYMTCLVWDSGTHSKV